MTDPGRLPRSVLTRLLQLVRTLRRAGLEVGTAEALAAVEAAQVVGLERRGDLRAALACVLLRRAGDRELFEQAFALAFGSRPEIDAALELLLPSLRLPVATDPALLRRLAESLGETAPRAQRQSRQVEVDAAWTSSEIERLREKDFEQMSAAEMAAARALLRRLEVVDRQMPTRRTRAAPRPGRMDLRATLRAMARSPAALTPKWRRTRTRGESLVLLCDVSGSMSAYVRAFLHFAWLIGLRRRGVHVFTFATRLTDLTRELRDRDVDRAMEQAGRAVRDWDGGTRIGESLGAFNRLWARRVLPQGATVLLLTDGLERGDAGKLQAEAGRLRRSCRRLIWLNPLLRYAGYRPEARGARSLAAEVDTVLPAHNVASLEGLVAVLARR